MEVFVTPTVSVAWINNTISCKCCFICWEQLLNKFRFFSIFLADPFTKVNSTWKIFRFQMLNPLHVIRVQTLLQLMKLSHGKVISDDYPCIVFNGIQNFFFSFKYTFCPLTTTASGTKFKFAVFSLVLNNGGKGFWLGSLRLRKRFLVQTLGLNVKCLYCHCS